MKLASRLNAVNEYYFSKKLREIAELNVQGKAIINLGIGSPDLAPAASVISELSAKAILPTVHGYQSYQGSPSLRSAIAQFYKKHYGAELNPTNEILPLIGSKEGIMHVCMTYLERGDAALVPNPGYPTYRSAVTLAGAKVIEYKLSEKKGWLIDFDALEQRDLTKVKLMFVNYPQMPTGAPASRAFFDKLINFAQKHGILIVHDNPYSFILNDTPMSICGSEGWRENAVELNSLSKSHNMAGWRIGWLAGKAERVSEIIRFKSNMDSGMFLPMQLAAVEALSADDNWYRDLNKIYERRQKKAMELLTLLGCRFEKKQQGLFVWAKIPMSYKDGYALADKVLYGANVFITPGGIFGSQGNNFVRVSLCCDEKIFDQAISRIRANGF